MSNENLSEQQIGYIEATACWSTKYVDASGFECLLSLQAETGGEVLKKAAGALSHLANNKCQPLQNNNHKGHETRQEGKSTGTVMVKPSGDGKNPVCPLHGVEMTKWSKAGRTWFSHRWNDGWCNGKQT